MALDRLELSKKLLSPTIRLLGGLLGEVIVEQEGQELLDLEEIIRLTAKKFREEDDKEAFSNLVNLIAGIEPNQRIVIIKAFSIFFQLVNLAEEDYRIHANKELSKSIEFSDTIEYAVKYAKQMGLKRSDVLKLLGDLHFKLVWTAHPTEARRLTTLIKLRKIFNLIEESHNDETNSKKSGKLRTKIKEQITILWQSDDLREQKVKILDEVRTNLFYFDNTVFQVLPEIIDDLTSIINSVFPSDQTAFDSLDISNFIEFGSWVGGDRDGHPGVTSKITIQTLLLQKRLCLRKYLSLVNNLIQDLSSSLNHISISDVLKKSLTVDESVFSNFAGKTSELNKLEPYRRKLDFIRLKLEYTLEKVEELAVQTGLGRTLVGASVSEYDGITTESQYYARSSDFSQDLQIIYDSLVQNRGEIVARSDLLLLMTQINLFGFHLASLDLRQHSKIHTQAIEEIFEIVGLGSFKELASDKQRALLLSELSNPRPLGILSFKTQCSVEVQELVDTLEVCKTSLMQVSPRAVESYIISMTHNEVDILSLALLLKETGLIEIHQGIAVKVAIDLVPLFETKEDLENAPSVMKWLFEDKLYRSIVKRRENVQEIMIGYSDSTKDVGYLQSNYRLLIVQEQLVVMANDFGIKLRIFHGRGGSISRGGGPTHKSILSQLPGTTEKMKITEQGEVIGWNYANPKIAYRHLEQIISAMITRTVTDNFTPSHDNPANPEPSQLDSLREMADSASVAYENLVKHTEGFIPFYQEFTPLDAIERTTIGSRPSRRSTHDVTTVDSLRAIPWIFSWGQTRVNFPAYYGVGTALDHFIETHGSTTLQEMYQQWPYFTSLIDNLQMVCLKADMDIAEEYQHLVKTQHAGSNFFEIIVNEFERTVSAILKITGSNELLMNAPDIQNSITRRNPYIDPLHLLQIVLIKEWRNNDRVEDLSPNGLLRAILMTINGIAAGLRNTG